MIRTLLMLAFWAVALPIAVLIGFPATYVTGNIKLIYRMAMWGAWTGVRLAGIRVETVGLERIDPRRTYIYMSNHVSNIDPPLLLPLIPVRTSVMAKKELFGYPLLGRVMHMGSLVPVDRGNREAGIAAVREASAVLQQGVSMTIFAEGKRSFDGKLLPLKKGPFYLAEQNNVPVVPITISGTHYVMPKKRFKIAPGTVRVTFHQPIEPQDFGSREQLMEKVRDAINSGLPGEYQQDFSPSDAKAHEGNARTA